MIYQLVSQYGAQCFYVPASDILCTQNGITTIPILETGLYYYVMTNCCHQWTVLWVLCIYWAPSWPYPTLCPPHNVTCCFLALCDGWVFPLSSRTIVNSLCMFFALLMIVTNGLRALHSTPSLIAQPRGTCGTCITQTTTLLFVKICFVVIQLTWRHGSHMF